MLTRAKELNSALRITFDPGHDWAMNPTAPILGILKLADYVFVNFREFKALGTYRHGQPDAVVARALLARCGPNATVFVTKRYDFVESFRGETVQRFQLGVPVESDTDLEDATGAGDVFSAAVLAALAAADLQVELGSLLGLSLARYKLQGAALPRLNGGFLHPGALRFRRVRADRGVGHGRRRKLGRTRHRSSSGHLPRTLRVQSGGDAGRAGL